MANLHRFANPNRFLRLSGAVLPWLAIITVILFGFGIYYALFASPADFQQGETVRITEGPFVDFIGAINDVDEGKGKVRVLVSFFGRETPVELDFLQVERIKAPTPNSQSSENLRLRPAFNCLAGSDANCFRRE